MALVFFTLLLYTLTPASRVCFIDLDPAAVFVPVPYFFNTILYTRFTLSFTVASQQAKLKEILSMWHNCGPHVPIYVSIPLTRVILPFEIDIQYITVENIRCIYSRKSASLEPICLSIIHGFQVKDFQFFSCFFAVVSL